MNKPRILLVYICYNTRSYLDAVVSALKEVTYPKDRFTIIFVPNGSPDGITEAIKKDVLPRVGDDLPECIVVDDGVNRGFSGGNNHGMQYAIDHEYDYVFLHNGDLKLEPNALDELVQVAEKDASIGSLQGLVCYWDQPHVVNTSGGVFHVAGYGFARDNLQQRDQVHYEEGSEVINVSGAAALYRVDALKKVGLLEDRFFMYHEDLELGLRLKIAGYRNVLVPSALAYHDYEFARNPKKFAWMELYRWLVVLAYYRIPTLILLMPLLICIEIGSWAMALMGGWVKAKFWQYKEMLRWRTWTFLCSMRRRAQRLRTIPDREILRLVSGKIEAQEKSNVIVERFANPVINAWFEMIRLFIIW